MALTVTINAKDRLTGALGKIGKGIKGVAFGFNNLDRIMRSVLVGTSIKLASDMDKGLREVGTLLGGLTDNQMKSMTAELENIASATGAAMSKLTKAKYDIVSAGFADAAESAKLLAASADLAVGGVTEVSTAADLLTTTINSYNLAADDAVEVSDKLFTVVRLGKTTMNELGGSMGRVLAIAGEAGVSLDEVGAALAVLTARGQDTAEATTAIRAAITSIFKPTTDLQGVIEGLGFSTGKAMLEQIGMADSLKRITEEAARQKIPMEKLFTNIRAMQSVLPLTGKAAEDFQKALIEMGRASGATSKAVKEMQKAFDFELGKLKQNTNNILREIGRSLISIIQPRIKQVNEILSDLGRIGWGNIAKGVTNNWRVVLEGVLLVTSIMGETLTLKLEQIFNTMRTKIPRILGGMSEEIVDIFNTHIDEQFPALNAKLATQLDALLTQIKEFGKEAGVEAGILPALDFKPTVKAFNAIKTSGNNMFSSLKNSSNDFILDHASSTANMYAQLSALNQSYQFGLTEEEKKQATEYQDLVRNTLAKIKNHYKLNAEDLSNIWQTWTDVQKGMDSISREDRIANIDAEKERFIIAATEKITNAQELADALVAIEEWASEQKREIWKDDFAKFARIANKGMSMLKNIYGIDIANSQKAQKKKITDIQTRIDDGVISEQAGQIQKDAINKKALDDQKKLKQKQQHMDAISASISGIEAVMDTYAAFGGWPLGVVPAAIMAGIAVANVSAIKSQSFPFGGRVKPVPGGDTVNANLNPREIISSPAAAEQFGDEIAGMNQAAEGGSAGGFREQITINAIDSESLEDALRRNPVAIRNAIQEIKEDGFLTGVIE